MRRSQYRRSRSSSWLSGRRRLIAAGATLVAFGGIVTVTQISDAGERRQRADTQRAMNACDRLQAPDASRVSTRRGSYTTNNGQVTQHPDDGAGNVATTAQLRERCRRWVMNNVGNNQGTRPSAGASSSAVPSAGQSSGAAQPSTSASAGGNTGGNTGGNNGGNNGGTTPPPGAGLGILTNSCEDSGLEAHDGFQRGNRCVSTAFGEVGAAANNPSLLIVRAPRSVERNTPFSITVSTRNLIRDRFLAAGQGGYYVESSVLQDGLTRGHFHSACRMLQNTNQAPNPEPVPAFFVATEDRRGSAAPDTVTINVPGLPERGTAQCASWAGDGSHRIPMMERANQTPAFDAVRIQVR